jgi:hypothetical protein
MMATRTTSSSSTILLVIILIITFPVWIALGAALFGVIMGLFGAAIGVIGAIFGVMIALITLPFKILFGWGDWGWHGFPHFHYNGFIIIALIIVAALIVRGRRN